MLSAYTTHTVIQIALITVLSVYKELLTAVMWNIYYNVQGMKFSQYYIRWSILLNLWSHKCSYCTYVWPSNHSHQHLICYSMISNHYSIQVLQHGITVLNLLSHKQYGLQLLQYYITVGFAEVSSWMFKGEGKIRLGCDLRSLCEYLHLKWKMDTHNNTS